MESHREKDERTGIRNIEEEAEAEKSKAPEEAFLFQPRSYVKPGLCRHSAARTTTHRGQARDIWKACHRPAQRAHE